MGGVAVILAASAATAVRLPPVEPAAPPAAVLIDAGSGQVLREQNADAAYPPGALANLMVVLLGLEEAELGALPLDVPVTVSAAAKKGAPMALRADKTYLLSDLLKAVLVGGVDEAAVAAAEAMSGSVRGCLEIMNARAEKLGMSATRFASIGSMNADAAAPADTTSARDLARLAAALLRHGEVAQWTSLSGLPFDQGAVLLRNVNQLLGTVPGVDGLQVASVPAARKQHASYSIVATAQRGALRLVAVVLGAADSATRYRSAADLLEWGFAHYQRIEIVRQGEPLPLPIHVVNGSVGKLTPVAGQTLSVLRSRDEEPNLEVRYQVPSVVYAPVTRQQRVGEVIVEEDGQLLAVIPVMSPRRVSAANVLSAALP